MKILSSVNEKNKQILMVEVGADVFQTLKTKQLSHLTKEVKVPGFRKGHVPKEKAEAAVDPKQLLDATFKKMIDQTIEWVKEQDSTTTGPIMDVVLNANIQDFDAKNNVTQVKLEYDAIPTAELDDYSKIVTDNELIIVKEVTDAEIEQTIENDLKTATMLISKNGAAEQKDVVLFDFEGYLGDQAIDNAKANNYELDLENSNFIPGFAEELIGLKKEDEKSFTVRFPADYHAEQLKDKDVTFKVKVHDVKQKEKPILNDEFVSSLESYQANEKNVDSYKKHLKEKLTEQKKEAQKKALTDAVSTWVLLNENNKLSHTPVETLQREFLERYKETVDNIENQFKQMGGFKKYLEFSGMTEEDFKQRIFFNIFNAMKAMVITDAIATKENLKINDEDLEAVKKEVPPNVLENAEFLEKIALQKKVVDFLSARVVYAPKQEPSKTDPEVAEEVDK